MQSERFIEQHADQRRYRADEQKRKISIYGQESNPTTWRLAVMNLAIRGIDYDMGKEPADTFSRDLHPDLRADFIIANPPFNMDEWGGVALKDDSRWKYGIPPGRNANFAWMQHMIHHLAPNGTMGLLLSNGAMSSNTNNEGEIRRTIIKADLIECMVALPGQLFTNTQIPACIWFLTRSKAARSGWRDREGEILFIDARNVGYMKDRVLRDFSTDDIRRIAGVFDAWKRGVGYQDEAGFCKNATLEEVAGNDYVLTPGRYVGAVEQVADGEPFEEKMARLTGVLDEQFKESARLEGVIRENLRGLGFYG